MVGNVFFLQIVSTVPKNKIQMFLVPDKILIPNWIFFSSNEQYVLCHLWIVKSAVILTNWRHHAIGAEFAHSFLDLNYGYITISVHWIPHPKMQKSRASFPPKNVVMSPKNKRTTSQRTSLLTWPNYEIGGRTGTVLILDLFVMSFRMSICFLSGFPRLFRFGTWSRDSTPCRWGFLKGELCGSNFVACLVIVWQWSLVWRNYGLFLQYFNLAFLVWEVSDDLVTCFDTSFSDQ